MGLFDSLVSSARQTVTSSAKSSAYDGIRNEKLVSAAEADGALKNDIILPVVTKKFTFSSLPSGISQMRALKEASLADPFAVAALCVAALVVCSEDLKSGVEMLNYLKGPDELTPRGIEFLRESFANGGRNLILSLFEGVKRGNTFRPSVPYSIRICENNHSRDWFTEGYISLCIKSAAAENRNIVTLRQKSSSDKWFLWEFSSLLSGIKVPE